MKKLDPYKFCIIYKKWVKQLFIKEADKTILNRSKEYYKNDKERLRERERETERQRDRETDRETDREKEKKINGRIW